MLSKKIINRRIGGDFELSDKILLGKEFNNQKYFYSEKKYIAFTDTGRSAIFLALKQIINNIVLCVLIVFSFNVKAELSQTLTHIIIKQGK